MSHCSLITVRLEYVLQQDTYHMQYALFTVQVAINYIYFIAEQYARPDILNLVTTVVP